MVFNVLNFIPAQPGQVAVYAEDSGDEFTETVIGWAYVEITGLSEKEKDEYTIGEKQLFPALIITPEEDINLPEPVIGPANPHPYYGNAGFVRYMVIPTSLDI